MKWYILIDQPLAIRHSPKTNIVHDSGTFVSVSYTHLDVYKRQLLPSVAGVASVKAVSSRSHLKYTLASALRGVLVRREDFSRRRVVPIKSHSSQLMNSVS